MTLADPTSTAAATLVAAAASVPMITAFGVPLGLRPDVMIAGFGGALVAIILLNTVPGTGDTWQQLLRTTLRRMAVTLASSLTAGYIAPVVMLASAMPDPLLLGVAFSVGAGAQRALVFAVSRVSGGAQAQPGSQP